MLEAAFFDLDGTLLDTLPDIRANLNAVLSSFGYPEQDEEHVKQCVGNGSRRLAERCLPEGADVEAFYAAFRADYARISGGTRPYRGIRELLLRWKGEGIKLAVISNKPQEVAAALMQKFFPGVFDYIGADSGDFPLKPDPAHARYAALRMRAALHRCMFVGDGETDVLEANNAGMVGVSALWGYRSREVLEAAGARVFASTPSELEKIRRKFF